MKYCPQCETRFDEEVIKFCTKDGTPLIEEAAPNFTAMPSENIEEDDIGEITIIRRKEDVPMPPPGLDEGLPPVPTLGERIRIPTSEVPREQVVRPRATPAYYPPPAPTPNTAKTVILTVLGTLLVLSAGAGLFWFLQKDTAANKNGNANNANQNVNINTNLGIDSNFNFNATPNYNVNTNYNLNTNLNATIKTPTPTPSPKPSPSASPSPAPSASPTPPSTPRPTPSGTPRPTPSGTPRMGPRPTPNPARTPN